MISFFGHPSSHKIVAETQEWHHRQVSVDEVHGLSQYLETGCPNGGFIDFCVSKVWYKVHTTNKINPIYLQILLFYASNCFVCQDYKSDTTASTSSISQEKSSSANSDKKIWVSKLSKNSVLGVQMTRWTHRWLSP